MEGNRGCGVRLGSECGSLEGDRMVKVSDSDFLCFFFRWHKHSVNGDQNITKQAYESIKQKSAAKERNRRAQQNITFGRLTMHTSHIHLQFISTAARLTS